MTTHHIRHRAENLEDYRRENSVAYPMIEILMISLCAVICGAESWREIEDFGKIKKNWLKKFLKLKNGIPCHDTFNRFFANICPVQFEKCLSEWVCSMACLKLGEVISLDGKTIRGAKEHDCKSLVHMVSAWANNAGLSLGQVKVDEKSNEITAIPKLLKVLDIKGCFVTIDAMGCQTDIAEIIDKMDGYYVLAVKENQKELFENINDSFRFLQVDMTSEHQDVGHGRVETRKCKLITDLSHIERAGRWKNISSIIKIESERYIKVSGKTEKACRYYISNSDSDAGEFNQIIRKHWAVENNLHWQLDVSFNEDKQRKRAGNAAQNFSATNKMALMLLKNEKTKKKSIKNKRFSAALDEAYLEKIIAYARKN